MDFKKLTKALYITVTVLTALSALSLLASFMFAFDMTNGYFTNGFLPVIFKIVFALGAVVSLASAFAFDKHKIIKTDNTVKGWRFLIILAAALVILSQIFNLFALNKYFTFAAVGICFFALYVFFCAAKGGYAYSRFKLVCLLLSAVFPVIMTIDNDAVMHRHSNSVENYLSAVFSIAFIMYILYEGKRLFTGSHSRWHFPSMLFLSHSALSLSLAYIIAYLSYDVNERIRFYQMILVLLIGIIAEIELWRFVNNAESRTKEEWDQLEAPEISEQEITEENTAEEKTDE